MGTPTSAEELQEIERKLGGTLPLSLRTFWRVVGSINLTQSSDQSVHDWVETPRITGESPPERGALQ